MSSFACRRWTWTTSRVVSGGIERVAQFASSQARARAAMSASRSSRHASGPSGSSRRKVCRSFSTSSRNTDNTSCFLILNSAEASDERSMHSASRAEIWTSIAPAADEAALARERRLIRLGWDRRVLQIKEKFGTLRFYVADRRPAYLDRIEAAVEHSAEICEMCGKAGTLRETNSDWYSTRCDGAGA